MAEKIIEKQSEEIAGELEKEFGGSCVTVPPPTEEWDIMGRKEIKCTGVGEDEENEIEIGLIQRATDNIFFDSKAYFRKPFHEFLEEIVKIVKGFEKSEMEDLFDTCTGIRTFKFRHPDTQEIWRSLDINCHKETQDPMTLETKEKYIKMLTKLALLK